MAGRAPARAMTAPSKAAIPQLAWNQTRPAPIVLITGPEQFLADRGSVTASARALYVHPNTVRQRIERIERVSGLDLPNEDLLSLELALKLARLHRVRTEKA